MIKRAYMNNINGKEIKGKILVVDDELIVAANIKYTLEKYDYEVVGIAGNANDAIELVKTGKPELILMDINLKDRIDGIALAEMIKKFADVSIIFLTAYSDNETIDRAKYIGSNGYLIKPFENRDLYAAIEMAVYKHTMEKRLQESENRMSKIADCYLHFEPNGSNNINKLTKLCGELLGADCALYNRLNEGMLCSWGQWNTPQDYISVDKPEGHLCYDVIQLAKEEIFIVRDLPNTEYFETDPNVKQYSLRTYVGAKEIPPVQNGLGVNVLSTSRGIVVDREARKLHVGGEILCSLW